MAFGGSLRLNNGRIKRFTDVRNIALYLFTLVVLAITWSGVKAVQSNYELQKKIAALEQQNEVLKVENQNSELEKKYLETAQYLELAARQNLGLAAPGERVLLVPKDKAMEYTDPSIIGKYQKSKDSRIADNRPAYVKNIEAWRDYLFGRKTFDRVSKR